MKIFFAVFFGIIAAVLVLGVLFMESIENVDTSVPFCISTEPGCDPTGEER